MKTMNKILAMILAISLCVGAVIVTSVPASAATSSAAASQISANLPIVTYAMPLSGANRVYSYSDASLSSRTNGYYIDTYVDQIVITQISGDGRAVYVTYPSSSSRTGYRSRWFAADDILGIASIRIQAYTAGTKSSTYRMSSASAVRSYGSIARNDSCVSLGSHTVGGYTYYPTIYPVSSGTYNGVSGVRHKLALATTVPSAPANPGSNEVVTGSGWQMPMSNAYCTWRSGENWSWATYTNNSGSRDYHIGIDIHGSNGTVYAAADGKVVAASSSNSGANGRYIIIQHSISGKTVYSFYAHLQSVNVSVGQTVAKGTKIGVAGGSGYGSNNRYGTHLHFAIVDTLWSRGNYYGYATYFTGNKVNFRGVTYYNPLYVINNNCLP